MARPDSLPRLLGCLPIAGKSGGDDGIAGQGVKEKQRMHESEENDGTGGGFIPYLGRRGFHSEKGARVQSSDRIHLGTGDQSQGDDEGECRSTQPRPHPAREVRVSRRRRGG
jgi:hypothetical protein